MSGVPLKEYGKVRTWTATSVRIPEPLHIRLRNEADIRDVGANWIIVKALERYFDYLDGAKT